MAKISQARANYRMGAPTQKCGSCAWYQTPGNRINARCMKVNGKISTYGLCDMFFKLASPFQNALTPEEAGVINDWYWQRAQEKGIAS